jgi:hypothetical protein
MPPGGQGKWAMTIKPSAVSRQPEKIEGRRSESASGGTGKRSLPVSWRGRGMAAALGGHVVQRETTCGDGDDARGDVAMPEGTRSHDAILVYCPVRGDSLFGK